VSGRAPLHAALLVHAAIEVGIAEGTLADAASWSAGPPRCLRGWGCGRRDAQVALVLRQRVRVQDEARDGPSGKTQPQAKSPPASPPLTLVAGLRPGRWCSRKHLPCR
jgi:hypothetical protein